jgi:multiple sugar transport system permease protein
MAGVGALRPAGGARGGAAAGWAERWQLFRRDYLWGYLFILPAVLAFAVFWLYPLVWAFILGFQKFDIWRSQWVGLRNYQYVLQDPIYQKAFLNTAIYTLATVPSGIAISLALALAIYRLGASWMQSFYKAAFYLPTQVGGIILALVWVWIFNPRWGLVTWLVGTLGLPTRFWLNDPATAMPSLIGMNLVSGHGAGVILYLAALGGIPRTLYEAADIDAASPWSKLRNVTWPLLKPTTLYVLVLGMISSFQVFGPIYVMTQGGPNFATITLYYYTYTTFFQMAQFGLAAAQAFVLCAIIIVLSVLQYRLFSTDVEY